MCHLLFEEPLTGHLALRPLSATTTYLCDVRLFAYVFWAPVSSSVKLDHEIAKIPSFFSELTGKSRVSCVHPVSLSHGGLCLLAYCCAGCVGGDWVFRVLLEGARTGGVQQPVVWPPHSTRSHWPLGATELN